MTTRPYGVATPDTATVFGSPEAASRKAGEVCKGKKSQFRAERTEGKPHAGIPEGWIVRIWPIGANPICGERKFLRVPVHRRPRRKIEEE